MGGTSLGPVRLGLSETLEAVARDVERGGDVYVMWAWPDDEDRGSREAINKCLRLSAKACSIFSRFLKSSLALANCSESLVL